MVESSRLGGGYVDSDFAPDATVTAVLEAAQPGTRGSLLVVMAGPPGVGKSAVAGMVMELLPNTIRVEKDTATSGFILQASHAAGGTEESAYGTQAYWSFLRPLEYAGATALACQNLVGRRIVLLVGGWGPELAVDRLWTGLAYRIKPASFRLIHLDAPHLETWRARMADRGSRVDSPWFEDFARKTTASRIWSGACRINTDRPLPTVVEDVIRALGEARE